ncbi:nucleoside triphosphate pyrophosphohydrolase [Desulfovibrio sp. An276]|uniref:nucleoside triphosphate pyrophosphohydrolase n=1 Tax=Desulfovibrio sp. An276 TaxID=1965618 RepID=UPI000B56A636|nr:nucleoside triphosphate pyrophosphohydrolase [Desulfovibrio sp. An276]OUO49668.1 nucleoside triphosphate pyrophosphohydrolase [Desulfovibrio sp. An276]
MSDMQNDATPVKASSQSDCAIDSVREVVRRLTAEDGCPWDKTQTPESLTEYVIEESHELVSAIRSGTDEDVCEELGDVAFLLLFIAHLYEKKGSFTLRDVFEKNAAKMIHRHPHVFAGEHFANLDEQLKAWEKLKQEEHKAEGKPTGVFDSLPRSLDPLARAYRIHSKAARTGFTWETREDVEQQVEEEWLEFLDAQAREDEKAIRHELGDLIFSIVELGRRNNLKANAELDAANERFLSRFRFMEEAARKEEKELSSMPLEEMDKLWAKAKEEEQGTE